MNITNIPAFAFCGILNYINCLQHMKNASIMKEFRTPIGEQVMTATERDRRRRAAQRVQWWQRPKAQQKADLETSVSEFLNRDRELNDREIFFLAEALAAIARGTFGVAVQAIQDAYEPESSFSPQSKIPPDGFPGTTVEALRKALDHSKRCPVREIPVFR